RTLQVIKVANPDFRRDTRSEKPQGTFRQSSGIGVRAGWRFAYTAYSDIKKLIGEWYKLAVLVILVLVEKQYFVML
ncbi:MAG: hypothetical protein CMI12_17420, partial [Oceanospirillum sp.]|nr:hypothetical protein [Oceanospirillum sp.]